MLVLAQVLLLRAALRVVDEDDTLRVKLELAVEPVLILLQDVQPVLLAGVRGLYGMARPFSPAWTMMPVFEKGKGANRCL